MAEIGQEFLVKVVPTIYVGLQGNYLNNFTNEIETGEIPADAVTRFTCTGYTVDNTEIIGNGSTYTLTLRENTKITFHWKVEHALDIKSELEAPARFSPTAVTFATRRSGWASPPWRPVIQPRRHEALGGGG